MDAQEFAALDERLHAEMMQIVEACRPAWESSEIHTFAVQSPLDAGEYFEVVWSAFTAANEAQLPLPQAILDLGREWALGDSRKIFAKYFLTDIDGIPVQEASAVA